MSDITRALPVTPVDQTGLLSLGKTQSHIKSPPAATATLVAPAAKATSAPSDKAPSLTEQLAKAAMAIEKYLPEAPPGTQLRIEKDSGSGLFVYQSVNSKSGEVVSQYPTEQVLKFISFYRAKEGVAVDEKI